MRRVLLAVVAAVAVLTVGCTAVAGKPRDPAGMPRDPKWKSTIWNGGWTDAGFVLNNNAWNGSAGPQIIWADSFHHWGAESTQPNANKVVQSYPSVEKNFGDLPVRSYRLIRTGFSESMPRDKSGLGAEAADDVWLSNHTLEVMIWVDNHGQYPMGRVIGHAKIFGQRFTIWHGSTTFTFALNHNETHGVTHILASINWLIRHRLILPNATLDQVSFGWEIASTGGKAKYFTMRRYWLHTRRVP